MTDWQERVCWEREIIAQELLRAEWQSLADRMSDLAAMMAQKDFLNMSQIDQGLLVTQLEAMNRYHSVLVARINRFVKDATEENAK
jgi:hypothetical protein